jgi:16S rRNA (uracil1498-N3)-methyltransferase
MRIFVAPPLSSGELTVRGDEHHYLARVRRAATGDTVELCDGEGHRAVAQVTKIGDAESQLQVGNVEAIGDRPPRIRVLVPLIKGDRMDTAIEKLVETGVDEIVVWPATRSVVKLEADRRDSRIEHYAGVAQAAARQSGRASIPTVSWADSLGAALTSLAAAPPGARLVLDPAADRVDLRSALARPPIALDRSDPSLPIDLAAARAFDESAEIAVTGRFQRPDFATARVGDDPRDPDDITSTGRFRRLPVTDWPLSPEPAAGFVDHATLVTGPEGGLAPAELETLNSAGFVSIGLGPRVLRAETAPAIVVALIRALTES